MPHASERLPPLSVVVATFNRRPLLERLLRQLAAQDLGEAFEVVVVDDGSTEPVAGPLRALELPLALTLLAQPNAGAAAARDLGVRQARGEVVVIVDDDMQVGPDFLSRHLALHRAHPRAVVMGRIHPDPGLAGLPLFERYNASRLDRRVEAERLEAGGDRCTRGLVAIGPGSSAVEGGVGERGHLGLQGRGIVGVVGVSRGCGEDDTGGESTHAYMRTHDPRESSGYHDRRWPTRATPRRCWRRSMSRPATRSRRRRVRPCGRKRRPIRRAARSPCSNSSPASPRRPRSSCGPATRSAAAAWA